MSQPRRSPSGDQRKRDAERTRERIIDAAVIEFGEHGFAGARTSAIAARAGVNQQLISYYFDGKEGLYRALQHKWQTTAGAARPDLPLAEVVGGFIRLGAAQRSWARLLAWEGLSDTGGEDAGDDRAAPGGAAADRPARRLAGVPRGLHRTVGPRPRPSRWPGAGGVGAGFVEACEVIMRQCRVVLADGVAASWPFG
jgi:AcrR family transcriptional regulator